MSPNDNFYNEENLEQLTLVQDIRHNYGFIFSQITELFSFYHPDYNKKLSKRVDDIETRIEILFKEQCLSEYLYRNFFVVYDEYPTLLQSKLIKERDTIGKEKQFERLTNLKKLLIIYIGELSEEIGDVVNKQLEYDKKILFKDYYKY